MKLPIYLDYSATTPVDPRVAVSIPVNMVTGGCQGGCLCENAPLLRLDLASDDLREALERSMVLNLNDRSFSITQEATYKPVDDTELRLQLSLIVGSEWSEYGEKQNDLRMEFRSRFYF